MPKTQVVDRLLRPDQAARRLGLSPASVRKLIVTGALGFTNVGSAIRKRYRVRESDIEEFLSMRSTALRCKNRVFFSAHLRDNLPANLIGLDRHGAVGSYLLALQKAARTGLDGVLPSGAIEEQWLELLQRAGLASIRDDYSIQLKLGSGFATITPPGIWPDENDDSPQGDLTDEGQ